MLTQPNNGNTPSREGPHESATNTLQNENDTLRARIAILEAQNQSLPQPFVADEEFEALRSQVMGLQGEEEEKAAVPEMVPGFRVNPLTHALTSAARLKADSGEQELELKTDGMFTTKKFNHSSERTISVSTWQAASKLAVELVNQHWPQGEMQAMALGAHHDFVTELADSHS
ncbi:hypothetical protein M422DRAFT_253769 [Sphaerobolus stellatus SS14]|uniref:Uncharacterized protein n=1 Tax=Sphaerobolus stellatus (strain SS14) TaxID=990650 RepID=A0A0C9UIX4_SPHS4|nr:hypothetical protein M422DRAFT_253769 [Sphaerobolus stellatus SS14]